MSEPNFTRTLTPVEMREFHAVCDRYGFDPTDDTQARLAARMVVDTHVDNWLTSRSGKRKRAAREAWVMLRLGGWELYGWRLFGAFMAWSLLTGIGRGVVRAWLG